MRFQVGVSRSCHFATFASGAWPCFTNKKRPSGFKTRLISLRAATGFGIEHNVHVITAVSMLESSTDNGSSAHCRINVTLSAISAAPWQPFAEAQVKDPLHRRARLPKNRTANLDQIQFRLPEPARELEA